MKEVGKEAYEKKIGIITNAGGMNIPGAVEALKAVAEEQEMHGYKIGYVTGDDLLDKIPQMIADGCEFKNMDDVGDFQRDQGQAGECQRLLRPGTHYGLPGTGRQHRPHRPRGGLRHVPGASGL